MSEWREKINYLQEKNLSIYIEKNGVKVFESYEAMLKPLCFDVDLAGRIGKHDIQRVQDAQTFN